MSTSPLDPPQEAAGIGSGCGKPPASLPVNAAVGRAPPDLEGGEGAIADRNKEAEREGRPSRPMG